MTANRKFKQLIRERMTVSGRTYQQELNAYRDEQARNGQATTLNAGKPPIQAPAATIQPLPFEPPLPAVIEWVRGRSAGEIRGLMLHLIQTGHCPFVRPDDDPEDVLDLLDGWVESRPDLLIKAVAAALGLTRQGLAAEVGRWSGVPTDAGDLKSEPDGLIEWLGERRSEEEIRRVIGWLREHAHLLHLDPRGGREQLIAQFDRDLVDAAVVRHAVHASLGPAAGADLDRSLTAGHDSEQNERRLMRELFDKASDEQLREVVDCQEDEFGPCEGEARSDLIDYLLTRVDDWSAFVDEKACRRILVEGMSAEQKREIVALVRGNDRGKKDPVRSPAQRDAFLLKRDDWYEEFEQVYLGRTYDDLDDLIDEDAAEDDEEEA